MKTLVLNKRNGGLTEVEYPFNSMESFAGGVLGFGTGGVALLAGSTFDGVAQSSVVGLPAHDSGVDQHKHVRAGYITGRGLNLDVDVICDGNSYTAQAGPSSAESHVARFGGQRDTRGRLIQFKLRNRLGSFFRIEQLEYLAIILYRKAGR